DQIDVLQRIVVDQKQVRERALFDDTKLARIGIALAGQRQQFGVCRRRHDQRFGGGEPLGHRGQNGPLLLRQRGGEQHVRPPRRLELVFLRQRVGRAYAFHNLFRLGSLNRTFRKTQSSASNKNQNGRDKPGHLY